MTSSSQIMQEVPQIVRPTTNGEPLRAGIYRGGFENAKGLRLSFQAVHQEGVKRSKEKHKN